MINALISPRAGFGAITFDSVDSYTSNGQSVAAVTLTHAVSGLHTLLLMQSQIATVPSTAAVTFATFNGIPLTRVRRDTSKDINQSLETWFLADPPAGPGTLIVMWGGTRKAHIAVLSYQGVDPTSPLGASSFTSLGNYATGATVNFTTTTDNSAILDLVCLRSTGTIAPGLGQTQRWAQTDRQPGEGDDSITTAAGNHAMVYTFSTSTKSAVQAVEIRPYIPPTPTATVTPSPTASLTATASPTSTQTSSATLTATPTVTGTPTSTPTPSLPVWPDPFTPMFGSNNQAHFSAPDNHGPGEFIIMTLHQRPIRDLKFNAGDPIAWDGKDASGQVVPGGLYLYLLRVDDHTRRGSIAVLR